MGFLVGSGASNTATGQENSIFFILRRAFGTVIPGNLVTFSELSWCTEYTYIIIQNH